MPTTSPAKCRRTNARIVGASIASCHNIAALDMVLIDILRRDREAAIAVIWYDVTSANGALRVLGPLLRCVGPMFGGIVGSVTIKRGWKNPRKIGSSVSQRYELKCVSI